MKLKSLLKEVFGGQEVWGLKNNLFKMLTGDHVFLPLSMPIVKKLVGNIKTTKAAHTTDINSLAKLLSLQGKKKGISTFTALDDKSSIMSGKGVATDGGVIVILSGDILFQDNLDIMTVVDKTGRRWAKVETIFGSKLFRVLSHVSAESKQIAKREIKGEGDSITEKEKQYFIKDYIDTATKLMLQHKDIFIEKYLKDNQYTKRANPWEDDWNEVILTKINIEAIAFIKDSNYIPKLEPSELEKIQKKYKNSEIITTDEIKNFLKKHGIKLYTS